MTAGQTVRLLCGLALASAAVLRVVHAGSYFFLFDDFALNGQASTFPLRDLVATPLFGFYRPGLFLLTRAAHGLFGWHTPSGYAAVILLLHAANAALVAGVAGRVVSTGPARWSAAALFFLAPWSAEAVFWVSGGFDVLATSGVLVGLSAGVAWATGGPRWTLPAVVAGTVVAVFSKESAVVLPALLAVLLLAQPKPVSWPRATVAIGVTLAITLAYLALRRGVLSSLSGVYGDWFALMCGAPLAQNAGRFVRAVFAWPARHDVQMRAVGLLAVAGPLATVALAALAVASWAKPRRAALLTAAIAVTVLPVLWVGLPPGSTGGGRVLYLAGVPFALLIATGVEAVLEPRADAARWAGVTAVSVVLVAAIASLEAQRTVWAHATRLSRTTIDAFRPFVSTREPLHIDNLPFWFEEGPYVIKSYAFGYYYAPAPVPPVTATALSLTSIDGRVSVTTRGPEPGASPASATGRQITLPVGVP